MVKGLLVPFLHIRFQTFILSTALKWGSLYWVSVKEHSVQRRVHRKNAVVDVGASDNEDFYTDRLSSLGYYDDVLQGKCFSEWVYSLDCSLNLCFVFHFDCYHFIFKFHQGIYQCHVW